MRVKDDSKKLEITITCRATLFYLPNVEIQSRKIGNYIGIT